MESKVYAYTGRTELTFHTLRRRSDEDTKPHTQTRKHAKKEKKSQITPLACRQCRLDAAHFFAKRRMLSPFIPFYTFLFIFVFRGEKEAADCGEEDASDAVTRRLDCPSKRERTCTNAHHP